ncbi:hypothetical protein LTR50_002104 [Elasticomyces elasticus]|nr:hypothetical protein LTR50_002104 [Elasticomyces elasticus]
MLRVGLNSINRWSLRRPEQQVSEKDSMICENLPPIHEPAVVSFPACDPASKPKGNVPSFARPTAATLRRQAAEDASTNGDHLPPSSPTKSIKKITVPFSGTQRRATEREKRKSLPNEWFDTKDASPKAPLDLSPPTTVIASTGTSALAAVTIHAKQAMKLDVTVVRPRANASTTTVAQRTSPKTARLRIDTNVNVSRKQSAFDSAVDTSPESFHFESPGSMSPVKKSPTLHVRRSGVVKLDAPPQLGRSASPSRLPRPIGVRRSPPLTCTAPIKKYDVGELLAIRNSISRRERFEPVRGPPSSITPPKPAMASSLTPGVPTTAATPQETLPSLDPVPAPAGPELDPAIIYKGCKPMPRQQTTNLRPTAADFVPATVNVDPLTPWYSRPQPMLDWHDAAVQRGLRVKFGRAPTPPDFAGSPESLFSTVAEPPSPRRWAIGSVAPQPSYIWAGGDGREIAFRGNSVDAERSSLSPIHFHSFDDDDRTAQLEQQARFTADGSRSPPTAPKKMREAMKNGYPGVPCGRFQVEQATEMMGAWCHACLPDRPMGVAMV